MSFDDITKDLDYACFFDTEKWTRDVMQNKYLIIENNGFCIDVDFKTKFGIKIGHTRGGVRFNRNEKTFEEYLDFIKYLRKELKKYGFIYLGISMFDAPKEYWQDLFYEADEYLNRSFDKAPIIYPIENWLSKFNSKKRYNLLYASKKNVKVVRLGSIDFIEDRSLLDKFYELALSTLERHKSHNNKTYSFPQKEVFERIFRFMDPILYVAVLENDWIAYSLVILNPLKNRAYRVYAGANTQALSLRAPSYLETFIVNDLYEKKVQVYDLYGSMSGKNHTYSTFKEELADEIISYPKYLVLTVRPILATLAIKVQILLKRIKYKKSEL